MGPTVGWISAPLLAGAVVTAGLFWLSDHLEELINRVEPVDLPNVTAATEVFHRDSLVVDLHGDSLLFGRDLLVKSDVGHIDLPRLREGGVGLQFFTVPTVVPLGFNPYYTWGGAPDVLNLASRVQGSQLVSLPPLERALWLAETLHVYERRSGGALVLVHDRAELEELLQRRAEDPLVVGGVLGIEGAHALEGDPANLAAVVDVGHRMLGLAHFFDNDFAGSAHGMRKYGLTPIGRELVAAAEEAGVLIDLAHSSAETIDDVLAMAVRPTVVSHTGVRGTCDGPRNLSDEQVRAIAAAGGVIGIGYWSWAVCGTEPRHISAAIRHVIELVGDDHVALGSDFDGGVTTGFDARGHVYVTQQLLSDGVPPDSVRKVLGGNALRLLREVLP